MPISRLDYKSLAAPALAKAPFAGVQARAFIASGLLTYQGPAGPEPIPAWLLVKEGREAWSGQECGCSERCH